MPRSFLYISYGTIVSPSLIAVVQAAETLFTVKVTIFDNPTNIRYKIELTKDKMHCTET